MHREAACAYGQLRVSFERSEVIHSGHHQTHPPLPEVSRHESGVINVGIRRDSLVKASYDFPELPEMVEHSLDWVPIPAALKSRRKMQIFLELHGRHRKTAALLRNIVRY